jgi:F0F1-type ATP synthase membrane subunit c/vacuolar-type H+-ATPase subunit K
MNLLQLVAEVSDEIALEIAKAQTWQPAAFKALMVAIAMTGAAMGLGMIGANYMKALGRNPEAGKAAGQLIVIAAMVEVTALLTLVSAFIIS